VEAQPANGRKLKKYGAFVCAHGERRVSAGRPVMVSKFSTDGNMPRKNAEI
jgi:hypothetical protein